MVQFLSRPKLISLAGIAAFALLSFTAKAQQVISLQQAVDLTIKNNLTIKQAQFTEALANEDYKQAKYNQLPSLSANPSGTYNFGRSANLTTYSVSSQTNFYASGSAQLSVTVFQGGQLRNQILQNKLILDADKTSTAKVKNDLLLNVVTDYLTILTDLDLVVAAKQQIDLAKITLDRAQKNFDLGNSTRADLAQAQAQLSTAELNLTTAQNQADLAILILKQYMEMDSSTSITVEKPDISKLTDIKTVYDATEVIKTAFTNNPDIRLAELQQETYAQAIKVAKGSYYPTVSFFAGAGSNYSSLVTTHTIGATPYTSVPIGFVDATKQSVVTMEQLPITASYSPLNQVRDNFNQSLGISVQIPIFNHFTARTSVTKAKLNYEYAQLSTQLAKNTLSKTIIQAVLDLQAAEKSYQSSLNTYNSNKEALNVTKQRFDAGLVNTLDYNTALTNYNKSQNDMIEAQYQVVFRSKVIDYYLGNPITL
ncbi:TolC family protein [Mucilaginibacter gotjawali]|uniref:Outer membrane protein n=1 Tax=Mucilaginibacter gotjawali TaxID=1550579 RepID=A0A839SA64_9SPHI|nr:TolC family protein [Mucilaginibacter gotjawali]MBB3055041.1 outer membrane protein [Mucilaginibacter gotjawali]